ncbi:MAG: pyridoxamine 5'-phosphate oxidase family protein, partial [Pseudomonadota bacterium]
MAERQVFHAGELAAQQRAGVGGQVASWAPQAIRTWMPDQHREFYTQLPYVIAAARDADDRPWVTLLAGEPGFIDSPDPATLEFTGGLLPGDALDGALTAGSDIGLLGIQLETRRRNRVNGTIVSHGRHGFKFRVG